MTPEDYQRAVTDAGEDCSLEEALTFMRSGYLPETAAYALATRREAAA